MPSRIIRRNKPIFISRDFPRSNWKKGMPRDQSGDVKDCATAIPPNSPASPFRAGVALWDREEKISYRSVAYLDPLQGWAMTEFWQERWQLDHKAIVSFVEHGYLDAAVCIRSRVKRYRCRDEYRLKNSDAWKKQKRRIAKKRHNDRRIRRQRLVEEYGW